MDACVNKNTLLVWGIIIFNACMLVYAGIQTAEVRKVFSHGIIGQFGDAHVPAHIFTALTAAMIGFCLGVYIILSIYLRKEFGGRMYRLVAASVDLRRRYMDYNFYSVLLSTFILFSFLLRPLSLTTHSLRWSECSSTNLNSNVNKEFDLFLFFTFCVQLIIVVLDQTRPAERILTIIVTPLAALTAVMAQWAVRVESKPAMYIWLITLLAGLAYFIFKLIRIWTLHKAKDQSLDIYKYTYVSLFSIDPPVMHSQCISTIYHTDSCYLGNVIASNRLRSLPRYRSRYFLLRSV